MEFVSVKKEMYSCNNVLSRFSYHLFVVFLQWRRIGFIINQDLLLEFILIHLPKDISDPQLMFRFDNDFSHCNKPLAFYLMYFHLSFYIFRILQLQWSAYIYFLAMNHTFILRLQDATQHQFPSYLHHTTYNTLTSTRSYNSI